MAKTVAKKVVLEVGGNQYDINAVTEAAMADYKKTNKAAIQDFNVYIKPEDGKAYYTANKDKVAGNIDL